MLFYNRTIHEIEKFSLKEKIMDRKSDSFVLPQKKEPCFLRSKERKYLCRCYTYCFYQSLFIKTFNISSYALKQETAIRHG